MALTRAQIQTAFQNSLGRAASANDENSFFSVSQSGALTDAQIFSTISNSQEANLNADPVVRFYQAAFGRVPDQAGLDNATDYVRSFGASAATYQNLSNMFAQSTEFTNRFGTGTAVDAAYVQALYTTILGRTATAGEINAYTSGANGYTTRGGVLYAVSQSQEAIGISDAAVNGFLNNAAQGTAVYSGTLYTNANGQPTTPGGATGATFTLTPGNDLADNNGSFRSGIDNSASFKFSAGNETVQANSGSLQANDVLLDNTTTDNDVLNLNITAATSVAPTLQNIETINLQATVAGGGIDLANATGTKFVNVSGSQGAAILGVNAQQNTPTISAANTLGNVAVTVNTLAGTTALSTAETLNLKVSGATFGTTAATQSLFTINSTVGGTLETLNIESTGGVANTFALATGGGVVLGTTNITGSTDATLRLTSAAVSGSTIAAAANTGIVTLDIDRNTSVAATTNLTNVTGVEAFTFRDSTAGTDSLSATNVSAGSTVKLVTSFAGANGVFSIAGAQANTADVLNLTLDHVTDATSVVLASTDIQNVETLNLTSTGNSAANVAAGNAATLIGDFTTVNLTGDTSVTFAATIDNADAGGVRTTSISAAGLTGTAGASITGTAGGTAQFNITGSANADTLTGGANNDTINGGAGNDRIVATAGLDTHTGGTGVDTFAFGNAVITAVTAAQTSITDFQAGTATGADRVELSSTTFGGTLVFGKTTTALTELAATGSAYNVVVLGNASYGSASEAEAALAGRIGDAVTNSAAVVFLNSTTGQAEAYYDTNIGNVETGGAVVTAANVFATFANVTTLVGIQQFDATNFTLAATA